MPPSPVPSEERRKKKDLQRRKRTLPPPKGNLLENFLASKKNSQAKGRCKNPIKARKRTYLPPKSFLCGPHFLRQRRVPHWSRAVYVFFVPVSETSGGINFSDFVGGRPGQCPGSLPFVLPSPEKDQRLFPHGASRVRQSDSEVVIQRSGCPNTCKWTATTLDHF